MCQTDFEKLPPVSTTLLYPYCLCTCGLAPIQYILHQTIMNFLRSHLFIYLLQMLRLLNQERWDNAEQKHDNRPGIDQHVVANEGADEVSQHPKETRNRLHVGKAVRAHRTLRRNVGNNGPGGVETYVNRQVERQRDGQRNPNQAFHPKRGLDQAKVRQSQNHQRRQRPPNHDKRPPPPTPEPDVVAQHANQDLPQNPRRRPRQPDQPNLFQIEFVLRIKNPTERGNLYAKGKTHRRSGQGKQAVIGQGRFELGHGVDALMGTPRQYPIYSAFTTKRLVADPARSK